MNLIVLIILRIICKPCCQILFVIIVLQVIIRCRTEVISEHIPIEVIYQVMCNPVEEIVYVLYALILRYISGFQHICNILHCIASVVIQTDKSTENFILLCVLKSAVRLYGVDEIRSGFAVNYFDIGKINNRAKLI